VSEIELEFHMTDLNPEKAYYAKTRNISVGGIGAEVMNEKEWYDCLIPKKTNLLLDLHLPGTDIQRLPCTVDWKERAGESNFLLGVSFVELAEEAMNQIHAFIVAEFIKSYGKEDSRSLSC
jgi:hypothetical protein